MAFGRGALLPGTGTIGDWFILTTTNSLYCCLTTDQWTIAGTDPYIYSIAQVLGNCDNTSDAAKPISTATQTALNGKGTSNFSGAYTDLTGKPTLGSAAATASTDYATAAQGSTANSALQPAGNGSALTGLTKTQVGLSNCDNTSDANKPVSSATQTALDLKQSTSAKGSANGYAGLDALGLVPVAQLPGLPAAWGAITGVLSAQTDLQTALNGKQASGTYATGTGTASGTNTGDQTSVSGNAGTATALATARAINGVNFDGTAPITVTAAGSTLSDTVTVAKGGTGLATLTAHAIQVGAGTSTPVQLAAVAIGQVLGSKGTTSDPAFVTYAAAMSTPANQTGNGTSTFKMNGCAGAITPTATGRVIFTISGSIGNGTTADSATWKLAYGTGSAPANAAAATGTVIGATGVFKALTGMLASPFIATGLATGLTLTTAYWYDLQIADITGGTASATAVTCMAWEV